MKRSWGPSILLVAGFFLVFAYTQADLGAVKGYTVSASFASVGGLPNGGEVQINGIKIGSVIDQKIDPTSFDAVVRMSISPAIHLPVDTVASVASEGLLVANSSSSIPAAAPRSFRPAAALAPPRISNRWKKWWARSSSWPPTAARRNPPAASPPAPAAPAARARRRCKRQQVNAVQGLFGGLMVVASMSLAGASLAADLVFDTAILHGLDKVTGRVVIIEAPVGAPVHFGTLEIIVRTCRKRPPEEQPEIGRFP